MILEIDEDGKDVALITEQPTEIGEVAGFSMIEVGRSSVQAWECDVVGHLNSQYYIERASDAATVLFTLIGLGPKELASQQLRIEPVEEHMRFLSELHSWRSYSVKGGFYTARADHIGIYCELIADIGSRVSAGITTSYRLRHLISGDILPLTEAQTAAAQHYRVEIPPHGAPRGIAVAAPILDADLARAEALAMRMVAIGVVKPAECDRHGFLLPRFFTNHFINGITALQQPDTPFADGLTVPGGAAVENRLVYRRWPRAGDALVIRSAITAAEERRYNWVHWMFDLESGELLASNEAVAICIDLDSRKSMPLPDHFRQDLLARINGEVRL